MQGRITPAPVAINAAYEGISYRGLPLGSMAAEPGTSSKVRKGAIPMQTTHLLTQIPSAASPAARPTPSSRNIPAEVLAGAGTLLLPVAMFLPWYRYGSSGETLSAWGGYWVVIAGMLLLFLAGAGLTASMLAGRPWHEPAVNLLTALAFAVTITVVIALFIARPGGNTTTAAAFGGYVGLAAIGTIKGAAILMTISARRRWAQAGLPNLRAMIDGAD